MSDTTRLRAEASRLTDEATYLENEADSIRDEADSIEAVLARVERGLTASTGALLDAIFDHRRGLISTGELYRVADDQAAKAEA